MSNAWYMVLRVFYFDGGGGGALPVMEGDGWVYDVKMPAEKQSITQRIVTKQ